LLADHVGHITGTDIAPNMIDIANKKVGDAPQTNVTFRVGDIFDPTNAAAGYDAVLAHNLLHLVDDLPKSLAHIHGLLKPGGLLISKTFCVDPAHLTPKIRAMRAILPIMQLVGKAPFVAFMTSGDYEAHITQAGFKIIETGNYPATEPRRYVVARKEG
jgi:SAM-dependent methyltransferase